MTFWNRRRLRLGDHQHVSSQIFDDSSGAEAPIGEGGGLTVDNTVDPPAEVTTLIAAGATIAGDEATLASSAEQRILLYKADIAFDSPNIDPAGGDHITAIRLIPGQVIFALWLRVTEAWTAGGAMGLSLLAREVAVPNNSLQLWEVADIKDPDLVEEDGGGNVVSFPLGGIVATVWPQDAIWAGYPALVLEECDVTVKTTTSAPTAGAAELYVWVAEAVV